jgi:hypothetical protein
VAFSEVRPTPWRQAVDLANMMLCLALRSDPAHIYERAKRQFSVAEITEAFAATRGLTMPSQLRHLLREQGRDLHAEFIGLLPERPRPVAIQRWSGRRVMLVIATALAALVLGLGTFIDQVTQDRIDTALETSPECTDLEPLWLLAQSVPSASMVPCLEVLPAGLHLAETKVNAEGATFKFERMNDNRMPTATALTTWFRERCDVSGAEQVATDEPGTQRYERTEAGGPAATIVRTYVFPGGCVEQRYQPPADPRVQPADEARLAVDFVTRDELADTLERRSGGRLHLDPGTQR